MLANQRTLVLSMGYEPVRVVAWQRAVMLMTLGKVEVLENYDEELRSVSLVLKIPSVVRLVRNFRRYQKAPKFCRVNIATRDRYRCQYCGKTCSLDDLTYDHVLPRSRGGQTSWENIVAACVACNTRKANRTPQEAGMPLLAKPVQPRWMDQVQVAVSMKSVPDAWRDYIYWTTSLSGGDEN